jgi:hypothetical protein
MADSKLEFDLTIAIPKKTLTHGSYYAGKCRNAFIARWDSTTGVFVHWRAKFNAFFTEKIQHPEDARDNHFDYFLPLFEIEPIILIPLPGDDHPKDIRSAYDAWEKSVRLSVHEHLSVHGSDEEKRMIAMHRRFEESHTPPE